MNSPIFRHAAAWVLEEETRGSDDGWARTGRDTDHGGPTRYGIASRWHPNIDLAKLTPLGAMGLYWDEVWEPLKLERMPAPLSLAMLDEGVHGGPDDPVRSLQRALRAGLRADGILGVKTLAALGRWPGTPLELAQACIAERIETLARRVTKDPSQLANHGWWARIVRLAGEVRALA